MATRKVPLATVTSYLSVVTRACTYAPISSSSSSLHQMGIFQHTPSNRWQRLLSLSSSGCIIWLGHFSQASWVLLRNYFQSHSCSFCSAHFRGHSCNFLKPHMLCAFFYIVLSTVHQLASHYSECLSLKGLG